MRMVLFLLISLELFGAPALGRWRVFYNSDGTSFEAKAQGNQYLNWLETKDGKIVKYNKETKNFEYGVIQNRSLKTSGVVYRGVKKAPSLKQQTNLPQVQKEELFKLWREKQRENRFKQPYK